MPDTPAIVGFVGFVRRSGRGYPRESRRRIGRGALEVLEAWCEVRMESLQVLEMCLKSGGVYACAEEEGGMSYCLELKSELLSSPFH
jgi:hypothetical protein